MRQIPNRGARRVRVLTVLVYFPFAEARRAPPLAFVESYACISGRVVVVALPSCPLLGARALAPVAMKRLFGVKKEKPPTPTIDDATGSVRPPRLLPAPSRGCSPAVVPRGPPPPGFARS